MVLVDAAANANANPKVQDEKNPAEWSLRGLWYGPCRRMPYEFAKVRKTYPNIPAENADLFAGQGVLGRVLSFNTCSVVVKTDYKGREVVKRTMLVSGRDVGKLEADVEKLSNKQ